MVLGLQGLGRTGFKAVERFPGSSMLDIGGWLALNPEPQDRPPPHPLVILGVGSAVERSERPWRAPRGPGGP